MTEENKKVEFLLFSKLTALLMWVVTGGKPFSMAAHIAHGPVTKVTQVHLELMKNTLTKYPKLDCVLTDMALRSLEKKLRSVGLVKKAPIEGEDHERARCLVLEWTVTFKELKAALGLADLDVGFPIPVIVETPVISTDVTSNEAPTTSTTTDAIDYSVSNMDVLLSMRELYRMFPKGFSKVELSKLDENGLSLCQATSVGQLYDRVRNQARRQVPYFVVNENGTFHWKEDFKSYLSSSTTSSQAAPAQTTPEITSETVTPSAAPEPVEPTEVPTEVPLPKTSYETRARLDEIHRRREIISEAKKRLEAEEIELGIESSDLLIHLERLEAKEAEQRAKTAEAFQQLCEANGIDPVGMAKDLVAKYLDNK